MRSWGTRPEGRRRNPWRAPSTEGLAKWPPEMTVERGRIVVTHWLTRGAFGEPLLHVDGSRSAGGPRLAVVRAIGKVAGRCWLRFAAPLPCRGPRIDPPYGGNVRFGAEGRHADKRQVRMQPLLGPRSGRDARSPMGLRGPEWRRWSPLAVGPPLARIAHPVASKHAHVA